MLDAIYVIALIMFFAIFNLFTVWCGKQVDSGQ